MRLNASDSQIEVADELAVQVAPNPAIYEDWIALAFPGVNNPLVIGGTADPDLDGVKNLVEFALGMKASIADALPFSFGSAGLPVGFILSAGATQYLGLRVKRPIGLTGILYGAQVSSDFSNWVDGLQSGGPTPNGDGSELVTFRDVQPISEAGWRFLRLRVTRF